MPAMSKDLFDETTMTFGEHLEALRLHLFKAVIGLVIVMIGTLYWGNYLVDVIRTPIDRALEAQQAVQRRRSHQLLGPGHVVVRQKQNGRRSRPRPNRCSRPTRERSMFA